MTGAECRALRQSVGWSQMKLAVRLDVDLSAVARWEQGRSPIGGPEAIAIEAVIAEEAAKRAVPTRRTQLPQEP